MFRSKKKLREQLQFEKEQNIALRRKYFLERTKRIKIETTVGHMKTAHQELNHQYAKLHFKYLRATAPEVMKKRTEGRRGDCQR